MIHDENPRLIVDILAPKALITHQFQNRIDYMEIDEKGCTLLQRDV